MGGGGGGGGIIINKNAKFGILHGSENYILSAEYSVHK